MNKKSTIAIYNTKGGVGKTSLSYNISKDLGYQYITNDISASMLKMSKSRNIKTNIPLKENTLYDFGGFEDKEAFKIINEVDLVIVPTICDMNSLARTLSLLKKIKHENVIVVGTMIDKKKDFQDIKKVVNHHFPKIKVFQFRKTRLLRNAMEEGISAKQLFSKKKLYKEAFIEYNTILNQCLEA